MEPRKLDATPFAGSSCSSHSPPPGDARPSAASPGGLSGGKPRQGCAEGNLRVT
jgi:hypothetical protein